MANENYYYKYLKYKSKYLKAKKIFEALGGTKRDRNEIEEKDNTWKRGETLNEPKINRSWKRGTPVEEDTDWSRNKKVKFDENDEDAEDPEDQFKKLKRENSDPFDIYKEFYDRVKPCIKEKLENSELKPKPKVVFKDNNIYIKFDEETYDLKNHISIHEDKFIGNRFHYYVNNKKTDLKIKLDNLGKLEIEKRESEDEKRNLRITHKSLKEILNYIKDCYDDNNKNIT